MKKEKKITEVEMVPVESSNIKEIGYDTEKKELHVHFKGGAGYIYKEVSHLIYNRLMCAGSVGGFLAKEIKPKYKFEKKETPSWKTKIDKTDPHKMKRGVRV